MTRRVEYRLWVYKRRKHIIRLEECGRQLMAAKAVMMVVVRKLWTIGRIWSFLWKTSSTEIVSSSLCLATLRRTLILFVDLGGTAQRNGKKKTKGHTRYKEDTVRFWEGERIGILRRTFLSWFYRCQKREEETKVLCLESFLPCCLTEVTCLVGFEKTWCSFSLNELRGVFFYTFRD